LKPLVPELLGDFQEQPEDHCTQSLFSFPLWVLFAPGGHAVELWEACQTFWVPALGLSAIPKSRNGSSSQLAIFINKRLQPTPKVEFPREEGVNLIFLLPVFQGAVCFQVLSCVWLSSSEQDEGKPIKESLNGRTVTAGSFCE
jgi:hypothetical protein